MIKNAFIVWLCWVGLLCVPIQCHGEEILKGPKYVRLTSPNGVTGYILGSCHIISLSAVLQQLPEEVQDQILACRYVVGEVSPATANLAIYKKRKKPQTWWREAQKNGILPDIAKILKCRKAGHSLKYDPEMKIFEGLEYQAQLAMRQKLHHLLPTVSGCMDHELQQWCLNHGGISAGLDDEVSYKFAFNQGRSRTLSSTKKLQNLLFLVHLRRYSLKATRLQSRKQQLKRRTLHTQKPRARQKMQHHISRLNQRLEIVKLNARKDFQKILPKKFSSVGSRFDLISLVRLEKRSYKRVANDYLNLAGPTLARRCYKPLIARDQFWHRKMMQHIETGQDPLFIFGYLHLGNVIAQFQHEGYRAEHITPEGKWITYPRL